MNILGITHPISWNNSASLIMNGKLIASAEEERFTRVKHAPHAIPDNAIKFVLKKAGLTENDIDIVAVGWGTSTTKSNFLINLLKGMLSNSWGVFESEFWVQNWLREKELRSYINKKFKHSKVVRVPHHLSHMASSCFVSGFKDTLFMTLDGRGEFESGIMGEFKNSEIEIFGSLKVSQSLGILYELFTALIGFRSHTDEGKTMGLAPYGKPINSLLDLVKVNKDQVKIDWKRIKKINPGNLTNDPTKDMRKDLAATAQFLLENVGIKLAEYLRDHSDNKRICLSGGTALNIDMNSKIFNDVRFDDIYIQPASTDAGCSLGAAAYVYFKETGKTLDIMDHAYLGADYTDEEVKASFDRLKIFNYERVDDVPSTVVELLLKDKLVAWFQGRFELGPRALGGRSLLANPMKKEMWSTVNNIKGREYWRPLAPSILEEEAAKFLENYYPSPFMLLNFKVKEDKIKEIPAVVHVDNTTRPQTVSKKHNEIYWELIKEFEKQTSVPVVINTSLNLKGEPIVNSPIDCVRTFFSSGIDYAIIGNYLLSKR
jgi:carbamoyltransferase